MDSNNTTPNTATPPDQQSTDSLPNQKPGRAGSRRKPIKLIVSVLVVVVIAAVVALVIYNNTQNNSQDTTSTSDEQSTDNNENKTVYDKPDFVTTEMQEEWINVYRETGSGQALEERVKQDFADNGVEFDITNPYHEAYLNAPEEFNL